MEKKLAMIKDLKQENDLLLAQLHNVQEELEHYYLESLKVNNKKSSDPVIITPSLASVTKMVNAQTNMFELDFRGKVDGKNWYYQEHDGRWAGPGTVSTIKTPALETGVYQVEFDIVDALTPEIFKSMKIFLNGYNLKLKKIKGKKDYPACYVANFSTSDFQIASTWEIQFLFSRTIAPSEIKKSDDHRKLAVRLRSLKISKVVKKDSWLLAGFSSNKRMLEIEEKNQILIGELKKVISEKTDAADSCHKQLNQFKKDRDQSSKQCIELRNQMEKDSKSSLDIANKLKQSQAEVKALSNSNSSLKNKLEEIQSQLKVKDNLLFMAQRDFDQFKKISFDQINTFNRTIDQQSKTLSDKENSIIIIEKQLGQMIEQKENQVKLLNDKNLQIEQLNKLIQDESNLVLEKERQIEQASKAKEDQAKLLADKLLQIEQLNKLLQDKSNLVLEKERQGTERKTEIDKLARTNKENLDKIASLEKELSDMGMRQIYLNQEIVRMESQIDLIKDLVLRDIAL